MDLLLQAREAVVTAIREQCRLSDEELEALIDAEPDASAEKRLVSTLLAHGLITRDQAVMRVYLRPAIKGA